MHRLQYLCVLFVASLAACSTAPQASADASPNAAPASVTADQRGPRCVAFVGSNDLHGNIEGREHKAGDAKVRMGGMGALSAYVELLRAKHGRRMVLVDAGDIYQGTLVSDHFEGKPMIEAMSMLRYDAVAIGNHEFDFGAGKSGSADRLAVIKQRAAEASFPFLSVNVIERATGKVVDWKNTAASTLIDADGVKVGIIGASTIETPKTTKPYNITTLDFPDPAPGIIHEAAELRARGAELIALVAHIGGGCKSTADANDTSTCDPQEELFGLLDKLPPNTLDVAIGGHTHRFVAHWVKGVATVEAGSYARNLSYVEACVGPSGFDRTATRIHRPIELCTDVWSDGGCGPRKEPTAVSPATFLGQQLVPRGDIAGAMSKYVQLIDQVRKQRLGVVLPRPLRRDADESLGTLYAEAMAKVAGTKLAIQNLGGVREDLPAGEITFGMLYNVLPFGNLVTVIEMSGVELRATVDTLQRKRKSPPFLFGMTYVAKGEGFDLALAGGGVVKDDARYEVAMSDFLSMGGDGLDAIMAAIGEEHKKLLSITDRDAMQKLLVERFGAKPTL